jgi:hypothetical protein
VASDDVALLLLNDLHVSLQLANRPTLLLELQLLAVIDLLLLNQWPNECVVIGKRPVELAIAIILKQVQVGADGGPARLVALLRIGSNGSEHDDNARCDASDETSFYVR